MRRTVLLAAAVCVFAVSAREKVIRREPPGAWLGTENERVALALVQGKGWSDAFGVGTGPTAHVAPLYPMLLSGVYWLWGSYETATGRLAQTCLSLIISIAAMLLLPVISRKLGLSSAAGWVAAFLAAWLPTNMSAQTGGHHDQLVAPVVVLGLLWIFADLHRSVWSRRGTILAGGFLVGLTGLLCPYLLLVPALCFLVDMARNPGERKRIFKGGLIIFGIFFVLVAPWMVRNYVVLGGFVPLRSNFGLELAVGNRQGADGHTYASGFYSMHPFCNESERIKVKVLGELGYVAEKQRQACAWIAAHPLRFAWLTLRRAWLFWFTPDEQWYSLDLKWNHRVRVNGIIGIAALVELICLLRRGHGAGWLLACTYVGVAFPYLFTHVEMRYRLPMDALFALATCNLALAAAVGIRDMLFSFAHSSANRRAFVAAPCRMPFRPRVQFDASNPGSVDRICKKMIRSRP